MSDSTLIRLLDPSPTASPAESARRWAPTMRALGDEHRLHIALLLADSPRTVKQLQEATGLSQTLVSHHLRPLREQGIVQATPQGRSNVYRLCCGELDDVVACLASVSAGTTDPADG